MINNSFLINRIMINNSFMLIYQRKTNIKIMITGIQANKYKKTTKNYLNTLKLSMLRIKNTVRKW